MYMMIMVIMIIIIITYDDFSCVGRVVSGICVHLFVFHTISQKLMQLGSPNLT